MPQSDANIETPTTGRRKSILIVDDEPQVLTALADLLEDDFNVIPKSSPQDALELAAGEPSIAVIISDQRMPQMSGHEFLARTKDVCRATRLLITGYADLEAVVRAVNKGKIFGYVSKPWDPEALRIAVHKAVEYYDLNSKLEQEQTLLRDLMRFSPDGIVFKDINFRFIRVNDAAARLLCLNSADDAVGRTVAELLPEALASQICEGEEDLLRTGEPVLDRIEQIPLDDGTIRWISVNKAPIKSPSGETTGLVDITRDVTATKQAEKELQQAQKMEAVGQLTGGVAHDFNNLLTVITGNLEMIADWTEDLDDAKLSRWTNTARRAARRGADLTQRLLAFSRRQVLEPSIVDPNQLILGMQDMLQRSLGEDVELSIKCAEGLPRVRVDAAQFESAALNLAVNARDAMPDGGRLVIETASRELDQAYTSSEPDLAPGSYVTVSVTDTGEGMSQETQQRVFEPFFTTKEQGKGTGLGLSMVYGFVKQSKGHVTIYSEPGQGTTVRLYFPSLSGEEKAREISECSTEEQNGHAIVLVVEDDDEVRQTAVDMLESLGYRVLTAENGPLGLEALNSHDDIELLFTDIVMPGGMTGIELARQALDMMPALKVLYTSGYAEDALRKSGGAPQDAMWIAKPYTTRHLAEKVRAALGGHDHG